MARLPIFRPTDDERQCKLTQAFDESIFRRAAEAAGFTFSPAYIQRHPNWRGFGELIYICGSFRCVCGHTEYYRYPVDELMIDRHAQLVEPGRTLAQFGSFSRQHLIDDGYSPEDVDRITKIYEATLDSLRPKPAYAHHHVSIR